MMQQKNKKQDIFAHYARLLSGAAILAFGLYNIHSQSGITEGGVLGLTLLLHHWLGLSPGITGPCMDILCYLIGYRLLGKDFLKNALLASGGFFLFYNCYEYFGYLLPSFEAYPLLAAITGGLFVGVGVGIVVREGGASGGDDALALVLSKLTSCRISKVYFFTDFVVLLLSLSYIPSRNIAFSLITVTLSSFVIDKVSRSDTRPAFLPLR